MKSTSNARDFARVAPPISVHEVGNESGSISRAAMIVSYSLNWKQKIEKYMYTIRRKTQVGHSQFLCFFEGFKGFFKGSKKFKVFSRFSRTYGQPENAVVIAIFNHLFFIWTMWLRLSESAWNVKVIMEPSQLSYDSSFKALLFWITANFFPQTVNSTKILNDKIRIDTTQNIISFSL